MRYIIFLIAIFFIQPALAAKPLTTEEVTSLFAPLQQVKKIEASFKQSKILKRFKTELKSSGLFVFKRQKPYPYILWEIIKPSPMKMEIDQGQLLLTELTFGRSTVKKIPLKKGGSELLTMLAWLTLDPHEINKQFYLYRKTSKNLQMYPKNPSSFIERIQLSNPHGGFFRNVQIFDKNNNSTKINFSKIKKKP